MADARRPWVMRAVYALICIVFLFLQLLPLDTVPRVWAAPEWILAVTFAWLIRRPEFVPPLLIALVFLLADLLLQKPPGLWAALVLLGSETLRRRGPGLRDMTFPAEWLHVATTLLVMTLGYRLVLGIAVIDQASLGLSLIQMMMTLAAYPVVVFVSQAVCGVRRRAHGDVDAMGHRI